MYEITLNIKDGEISVDKSGTLVDGTLHIAGKGGKSEPSIHVTQRDEEGAKVVEVLHEYRPHAPAGGGSGPAAYTDGKEAELADAPRGAGRATAGPPSDHPRPA